MEDKIKNFVSNILKQIDRVKREDAFLLLPPRVYEPSISHKLAEYIQNIFPKYNVDVEYDKYDSSERKELEKFRDVCPANSTDGIRPDIVVHRRGIQCSNLLVIELKDCMASQSSRYCVEEKLKGLTKRDGQFGYLIGILWLFGPSTKEEILFYINGIKYNTSNMHQIIDVLRKSYEIPTKEHYLSFLQLKKALKKNWESEVMVYEEEERKEEDEKMEQEIMDSEYFDLLEVHDKITERQEEDRLASMSILDRYQETGMWEDSNEEESAYDENMIVQQEEELKRDYIEESISKYKQGLLYDNKLSYSIEENDNESRKLWLNAWKDLQYLSNNSILIDLLWCIREQRELLELAFEYNLLNIFNSDDEKDLAKKHLEFLIGWVEYQKER